MTRCWLSALLVVAGLFSAPSQAADAACQGRFVNPITDICWRCIFPLSIGSIPVGKATVLNDKVMEQHDGTIHSIPRSF